MRGRDVSEAVAMGEGRRHSANGSFCSCFTRGVMVINHATPASHCIALQHSTLSRFATYASRINRDANSNVEHVTSHHITSHHITSHLSSPHLISSHLISSHLISSHLISSHLISSHLISSHQHAQINISIFEIGKEITAAPMLRLSLSLPRQ